MFLPARQPRWQSTYCFSAVCPCACARACVHAKDKIYLLAPLRQFRGEAYILPLNISDVRFVISQTADRRPVKTISRTTILNQTFREPLSKFTSVKKSEIKPAFLTSDAFEAFWFRNRATYWNYKTRIGSAGQPIC